jgi:hypothetical protein
LQNQDLIWFFFFLHFFLDKIHTLLDLISLLNNCIYFSSDKNFTIYFWVLIYKTLTQLIILMTVKLSAENATRFSFPGFLVLYDIKYCFYVINLFKYISKKHSDEFTNSYRFVKNNWIPLCHLWHFLLQISSSAIQFLSITIGLDVSKQSMASKILTSLVFLI